MSAKAVTSEKNLNGLLAAAFLAVLCGMLGASVQLALEPVPTVKPDADDRPDYAIVSGPQYGGARCTEDARALLSGAEGEFLFSAGALNQLSRSYLQPVKAKRRVLAVTDSPSFWIAQDGRVRASVHLSLPLLSAERQFSYQVEGTVADDGFHPSLGWLGRCPLPLFNGLLIRLAKAGYDLGGQGEALDALPKRSRFSVQDGVLRVVAASEKKAE